MPNELNAAQWLAAESDEPELLVVGVPNSKSTDRSSADLAPLEVRHRLTAFPSGPPTLRVRDAGNLPVSNLDPVALLDELPGQVSTLPRCFRIYLGGDTAITRPLVAAEDTSLESIGLIRFDGERRMGDLASGPHERNVVSGLIEDGLPTGHIVEIGTRLLNGDDRDDEAGITTIPIDKIDQIGMGAAIDVALGQLDDCSRVYVSVDLGVLDQSVAPGAHDARPGGLTTRELAAGLARCARHRAATAVDLVGVDPALDRDSQTLDVMAHLLLTTAAGRVGLSLR